MFELEPCIHPTVMKDMCAECGADLRKSDLNSTASVPMVHSVPELKVSEEVTDIFALFTCKTIIVILVGTKNRQTRRRAPS